MRKYFFVLDEHKFSLWHRRKKVEQSRVKWWRLGFRTKVSAAVEPVAGQPHLPLNRSRRSGRYFRNSITNSSPETGISNFVIIFHQRKVAGATWITFLFTSREFFSFFSFSFDENYARSVSLWEHTCSAKVPRIMKRTCGTIARSKLVRTVTVN